MTHKSELRSKLGILRQATLFRQHLPLVLAERFHVVGHLRRTRHHFKRQLANAHAGIQGDGHAVEVADFQRDSSGEAGIHKTCRGVDDDAQATERTSAFHTDDKIVRHRERFHGDAQDELPWLDNKRVAVRHRDGAHVAGDGFGIFGIQHCELAVFVQLEDIAQPQIHGGRVDVSEQLFLRRLDLYPAAIQSLLDVTIG